MIDNDANLKAGQGAPNPWRGPKASNTLETLRPREVNVPQWAPATVLYEDVVETDSLPLQGRGLPPLDYESSVVDGNSEYLIGQAGEVSRRLAQEKLEYAASQLAGKGQVGNVLSVDWPSASPMPPTFLDEPLTLRVTRLEEQMDGLLDRLAIYNTKSSHKI